MLSSCSHITENGLLEASGLCWCRPQASAGPVVEASGLLPLCLGLCCYRLLAPGQMETSWLSSTSLQLGSARRGFTSSVSGWAGWLTSWGCQQWFLKCRVFVFCCAAVVEPSAQPGLFVLCCTQALFCFLLCRKQEEGQVSGLWILASTLPQTRLPTRTLSPLLLNTSFFHSQAQNELPGLHGDGRPYVPMWPWGPPPRSKLPVSSHSPSPTYSLHAGGTSMASPLLTLPEDSNILLQYFA